MVELLVKEDPHLKYEGNGSLETPLYLACVRGYMDIVETILNNCQSLTFDDAGPAGKTPLHAAVTYSDSNGHEIVKLLLKDYKDLVDQKDDGGKTALHLVASNNLPMIVDDLVAAKSGVGYLEDNYGLTALHIAAHAGNIDVMVKLLEHYPDLWNNHESRVHQNILHIAVVAHQKEVIKFILSLDGIKELLIRGDKCGNTPLHYIAMYGCYVEALMDIRELDWKISNFNNITPIDILLDGTGEATVCDQESIRTKLNANAEFWRLGRSRTLELEAELKRAKYAEKEERHKIELAYIKNTIGNHMVVAALIVTVSLTAGFAMPGGFNGNEGSTQGSALLSKKPAFMIFLVADTLALFLSVCALSLYFMSTLQSDVTRARRLFFFAVLLNLMSLMTLVVAFITATYSVLIKPSRRLAISLCAISSIALVIIIVAVISLGVSYKWYKLGYGRKWKRPNKVQRLMCFWM